MIDNVLQHLYMEAKREAEMPKCERCENAIWDDELVDIEGRIFCMRCARQLFVKWTDDYVLEE